MTNEYFDPKLALQFAAALRGTAACVLLRKCRTVCAGCETHSKRPRHRRYLSGRGEAYAEITNIRDKADLARWREMRDGVLRVVDSFIVQ